MKTLLDIINSLILFSLFIIFYFTISVHAKEITEQTKNNTEIEFKKEIINTENDWIEIGLGISYYNLRKTSNINKDNSQTLSDEFEKKYANSFISIHALKFDLTYLNLSVFSAKWNDNKLLSIDEWIEKENLVAAINASMYLTDNLTSNGYFKKGELFNNAHIGKNLGGFFLSNPVQSDDNDFILPQTAIIYNNDVDLSRFGNKNLNFLDVLNKYDAVVQNFKLFPKVNKINSDIISHEKNILWPSQRKHHIAAIAEDEENNIIFLFSEYIITIQEFADTIQTDNKLKLQRAIYTEGGRQAVMGLNHHKFQKIWQGHSNLIFLPNTSKLPNIIGVKYKKSP